MLLRIVLSFFTLWSVSIGHPIFAQTEHLKVPEGFRISVFADGVYDARQITIGKNGTVFVGSRGSGKVWALQDTNNDKKADKRFIVAENLTSPSGVAYHNGDLYIAAINHVYKLTDIENNLSPPPKPELVFSNLPSERHHGWKNIGFSPSGELYVPVGAPCNVCEKEDPRFASILKVVPGTDDYTIVAHGVRNSVGFDWHPKTQELWFSDNGRDRMGDDVPPCEINRLTEPGQHFGFPYIHAGAIADPKYFDGHVFSDYQTPALSLEAHVAPLGVHFYRGEQFPSDYQHQLFVAEHGSWDRSTKSGYRVMLARLNNNQITSYSPVVTGFLKKQRTMGRPVAFAETQDGSLLISDDYADQIYLLEYPSKITPP